MKLHVNRLCEKVGMSRQNFYKGRTARQKRKVEGEKIAEKVKRERQTHPRMGGKKIHGILGEELRRECLYVGRDIFFDVLREHGLLVEKLPKAPCTTNSDHNLPVFSNILDEILIDGPNKAWGSDLTFLRVGDGFMYLSLTTDMFSRDIVGWHLSENMKAADTLKALEMALANKPGDAKPVHHSDRGSQYCSHLYVGKLKEHGLGISMTEKNHCAENALAERVNGILKQEYGLGHVFANAAEARLAVEQAIWIYNHKRPHMSLGMRTPAEVHAGAVA